MRKIVVVGHSHMVAVRASWAAESARADNARPTDSYRFVQLHQACFHPAVIEARLNTNLRMEIAAQPCDALVTMIGGNEHAVFGLLNHPVKFDFVLPERPDLPIQPNTDVIPCKMIARQLEGHIARSGAPELFAALRNEIDAPLYHVESPPPVGDEEHIRRYPGVFRDKLDELGVAPATLRYKLWRLQSDLYRRLCERYRIGFIPAPEAMIDEDGMMRRQGWNADPTHGNAFYGRHVLLAVEAQLQREQLQREPSPAGVEPRDRMSKPAIGRPEGA